MKQKTFQRIEAVVGVIVGALILAGLVMADRYLWPNRISAFDPDERDPIVYRGRE